MRYLPMVAFNVAVVFLTANGASAQHAGTKSEQDACARDASRFCRMYLGNDGAVQSCLQMRRASLSARCRKVFERHGM